MKNLRITVNGRTYELAAGEHETLAFLLRERIGLTGTKTGCSQGSCGACTVLVNDKAVLSCITPAMRCHESRVTTIEGISSNGELHRLQKLFVDKGAVQCGFCTPGMVMTALEHIQKNPKPSVSAIYESHSAGLRKSATVKISSVMIRFSGMASALRGHSPDAYGLGSPAGV